MFLALVFSDSALRDVSLKDVTHVEVVQDLEKAICIVRQRTAHSTVSSHLNTARTQLPSPSLSILFSLYSLPTGHPGGGSSSRESDL